ncbi:3-keto-5-aminohexanoate cleavage protein [Halocynthiibacter sp. C4]|uniref:3-keto-5-aminohexanoate cleavage protein n=1 Tax=Halocynthiibacter sp. C4 TaxID=2992758 RepID=UPI00237A85A3|nr:3-keto-5-aminohexanoate cleavage protein [Halocynthiibacter sp. C4]MDE0590538.1 3-keto-5-aminohexanoate cleavage protein [Halocynthiibacter sp. C4]
MAKPRKVIISCALTGAIHTPSMSPHLPVTPDEIIAEGRRAADAGASILHVHARDPETGRPDQSVEAFSRILPALKETGAVINVTTGGSPFMDVSERAAPALHYKPELASLNMGSMNFGLYPMLDRFSEFEHDWERAHLENSKDVIFKNTFGDIEYILGGGLKNGTRFEFECYDISHLYSLQHMAARKGIEGTLFVQSVFGLLGGIGGHPEDVQMMRRTADRLLGDRYEWSVLGAGANQLRIAAMSAAMGGHIRVGLEDSLWAGPGEKATSSAQQVELVGQILAGVGAEMATPDEARDNLGLKGASEVNF